LAGLVFSILPAWFSIISSASWVGYLPTALFGLGAVGLAKQPRGFLADIEDQLQRLTQHFFRTGPPTKVAAVPPSAMIPPVPGAVGAGDTAAQR
jgi:hypothetical protein